jgi:hypothetical protein
MLPGLVRFSRVIWEGLEQCRVEQVGGSLGARLASAIDCVN